MTTIKTAVSIEETLFRRVEATASEMQVSRSRLISMALEVFFAECRKREIGAILEEEYADGPTEEEQDTLNAMRRYQVKLWQGEPW
jgi:hypothetical protein